MKPPVCEICHREFNPDKEGGLVFFRETEKGREFERRARREGITGHPPDAAWFCGSHSEEAKELAHLTIDEAMEILKKKFEPGSIDERKPEVGEEIYIPTALYLTHGVDDFLGGLCRIIRVKVGISAGKKTYFIEVEEDPDNLHNWRYILENQERWRREYKDRGGRKNPDLRREFNEEG